MEEVVVPVSVGAFVTGATTTLVCVVLASLVVWSLRPQPARTQGMTKIELNVSKAEQEFFIKVFSRRF
jgi:hypothetical protein